MKYIFIAGAPGSKWSSVSKNIYFSPDIDRSDYSSDRLYYHDAVGYLDLMHMGAYFDPGMEFGDFFDRIDQYSTKACEEEFDRPFTGTGVRIVKSHVFSHHINFLKLNWPDCPIVLVHRPDDACLGWWVKCGHFDITYPLYNKYYMNLKQMALHIKRQNQDIEQAMQGHQQVSNNRQLASLLDIAPPPEEYWQNYAASDIKVTIL
jgi:hypothetical protein